MAYNPNLSTLDDATMRARKMKKPPAAQGWMPGTPLIPNGAVPTNPQRPQRTKSTYGGWEQKNPDGTFTFGGAEKSREQLQAEADAAYAAIRARAQQTQEQSGSAPVYPQTTQDRLNNMKHGETVTIGAGGSVVEPRSAPVAPVPDYRQRIADAQKQLIRGKYLEQRGIVPKGSTDQAGILGDIAGMRQELELHERSTMQAPRRLTPEQAAQSRRSMDEIIMRTLQQRVNNPTPAWDPKTEADRYWNQPGYSKSETTDSLMGKNPTAWREQMAEGQRAENYQTRAAEMESRTADLRRIKEIQDRMADPNGYAPVAQAAPAIDHTRIAREDAAYRASQMRAEREAESTYATDMASRGRDIDRQKADLVYADLQQQTRQKQPAFDTAPQEALTRARAEAATEDIMRQRTRANADEPFLQNREQVERLKLANSTPYRVATQELASAFGRLNGKMVGSEENMGAWNQLQSAYDTFEKLPDELKPEAAAEILSLIDTQPHGRNVEAYTPFTVQSGAWNPRQVALRGQKDSSMNSIIKNLLFYRGATVGP